MEAKTEQVKWWKTPSQNAKSLDLLLMKVAMLAPGSGALYAVNIGGLCGLQRGDPSVAPYTVELDLLDTTNRHYGMRIDSPGKLPTITQAQINAIIASIHPLPQN